MTTLVTGAGGFIGSRLLDRLEQQGHSIRCIIRSYSSAERIRRRGIEVFVGDLLSFSGWKHALSEVNLVFHVAGMTHALHPNDYDLGNHITTERLADAVLRNAPHIERLLYVSSLSAVGPAQDSNPLTEDTDYHPVSAYGRSKMLAELSLAKFSDYLPITIVRPSAVFGPGERDLYQYFLFIKRGFLPLAGYSSKIVNLVYNDDVVEGIILAAQAKGSKGKTYFLGSEKPVTDVEITTTIAAVMNKKPFQFRFPQVCLYPIALGSELYSRFTSTPVFLNREKIHELAQSGWNCSIARAQHDFGYSPRWSLLDGIQETYDWYRLHRML